MSKTGGMFSRFVGDRGGNVVVIFAVAITSVVLVGGGAIDLMTVSGNGRYLQDRVDSAALYVANGMTSATTNTAQAKAEARLRSLVDDDHGTLSDIVATTTSQTVTVSAKLTTRSNFLALLGLTNLTSAASSSVTWGDTSLEVAIVFDTTGSMADNGKIAAAKSAAKSFVEQIAAKATTANSVKFSFVPFSNFVNVGTANQSAAWMDTTGLSPYHSSYFSAPANRFALYTLLGKSWKGCVETRPAPYDIDDTAPVLTNPSTLFVPSFHPDEPANSWGTSYANSYLNDDVWSSDDLVKMKNVTKYTTQSGKDYSPSYFYSNYNANKGPSFNCETSPMIRLTATSSTITTAIDNVVVAGSTNIPEGLAWGWRVLSPKGPYADGKDYSSNTYKIVVLMTDGTNAVNTFSTSLGGAYSSWGYPYSGRLGSNPGTNLRNGLDAKTREVCTAMKAKGIKLYTIGLMIDDTSGQTLLSDCSSGTDYTITTRPRPRSSTRSSPRSPRRSSSCASPSDGRAARRVTIGRALRGLSAFHSGRACVAFTSSITA